MRLRVLVADEQPQPLEETANIARSLGHPRRSTNCTLVEVAQSVLDGRPHRPRSHGLKDSGA
jgi:hypothetical protein